MKAYPTLHSQEPARALGYMRLTCTRLRNLFMPCQRRALKKVSEPHQCVSKQSRIDRGWSHRG